MATKMKNEANLITKFPILIFGTAGWNSTVEFIELEAIFSQRAFGEFGQVVKIGEFQPIQSQKDLNYNAWQMIQMISHW